MGETLERAPSRQADWAVGCRTSRLNGLLQDGRAVLRLWHWRRVQADAKLPQLALVDRSRSAGHRVLAGGRLGKCDHIPDRLPAGEQRRHPVEPERDAAVRRRAVLQRLDQEAEFLVGGLAADAERLEHAVLNLGPVDPDAP